MASSTLVLHCGGKVATRDDLRACPVVDPTMTWNPIPHVQVLEIVERQLQDAGYGITRSQYGLACGGHQFFAALDLESSIAEGVGLALGLRNSTNKVFPIGAAGGTRTFVCDNLALTGDWADLTIARRHTRWGHDRFAEALAVGISKLGQYRDIEAARTERMRAEEYSDDRAFATLLRAFDGRLLNHTQLREAIGQWRDPSFDWGGKSAWRLYNCCTTPLQARATSNPAEFARSTQKLMGLIAPLGADEPGLIVDVTGPEALPDGRPDLVADLADARAPWSDDLD